MTDSPKQEMAEDEKVGSTTVEDTAAPRDYSPEEVTRVVKKLDWHILPLCFILYTFSVLDRSNLGNARLAGLEEDLELTGSQYQWLATW